jgi:hypothetical protein
MEMEAGRETLVATLRERGTAEDLPMCWRFYVVGKSR